MNRYILMAVLALLFGLKASANDKLNADKLSVVSSFPLSGPNYDTGTKIVAGATIYFDYFNKNSQINIDYKYIDDGYRRLKFRQNILNSKDMDLVFMPTGTENIRQIVPQILSEDIVIFAPFSGANFLNFDVFTSVINTTPPLDVEMEGIVKYFLDEQNLSKISLFYQSGEHGEEVYNSLQKALSARGYGILSSSWYKKNSPIGEHLVDELLKNSPEVIIISVQSSISAKLISELKKRDKKVKLITINVVNADEVLLSLGDDLDNIYFSTFTPPFCNKSKLANLYLNLSKTNDITPSLVSYSAFLNAFLLAKTFEKSKFITIKKSFIARAKEIVREYKLFEHQRIIRAKDYLVNLQKVGAK